MKHTRIAWQNELGPDGISSELPLVDLTFTLNYHYPKRYNYFVKNHGLGQRDLTGIAPAWKEQGPEFSSWYPSKKKKKIMVFVSLTPPLLFPYFQHSLLYTTAWSPLSLFHSVSECTFKLTRVSGYHTYGITLLDSLTIGLNFLRKSLQGAWIFLRSLNFLK